MKAGWPLGVIEAGLIVPGGSQPNGGVSGLAAFAAECHLEGSETAGRSANPEAAPEPQPDEFDVMQKAEPDPGVHNVRNTDSAHWRRWLAPQYRVVVPFNSFAE